MFNFIKNISPTELIIIAAIFILIFGSRAVTKLGRSSGETFKEMKKIKRSITSAIEDDEPQKKGVSK